MLIYLITFYTIFSKRTVVLPGLSSSDQFESYSGYINVSNSNRNIFYWFVPAFEDPSSKPLLWWSNGGPGCSGLQGLMNEMGPVHANQDHTLSLNPNTWNRHANIVYVEQPAGVGFSYWDDSDVEPEYFSDQMATDDNLDFILKFLQEYPEYQSNEFYLTSESWGGHYVPLLTKEILMLLKEKPEKINFKGFLLGNPYTNNRENIYGMLGNLVSHNLIPRSKFDELWEFCKEYENLKEGNFEVCDEKINDILQSIYKYAGSIYFYGVDYALCQVDSEYDYNSNSKVKLYDRKLKNMLFKSQSKKRNSSSSFNIHKYNKLSEPLSYQYCQDNYTTEYFNLPSVQKALNVYPTKWGECDNNVSRIWDPSDGLQDLSLTHEWISQNHSHISAFKAMIFSGDDDLVCATLGTQYWMDELFQDKVKEEWHVWKYDSYTQGEQVGGFEVGYENGYYFRTVHSAGHMVPQTQPERAERLLIDFLKL